MPDILSIKPSTLAVTAASLVCLASLALAPLPATAAATLAPVEPSPPAQGRTEQDRALRYFDMSFSDAMYTALVEGDFEVAIATLGGFAGATNTAPLVSYVSGVQALKRGDFAAAARALQSSPDDDLPATALLMISHVELGQLSEATALWERLGDTLGPPFHHAWRGWLAERAGDTAGALAHWRTADQEGELLFNPALAQRYFVLLSRADGKRAAIARMDDIFGAEEGNSAELRQLRADIQRGRAQLPDLSPRQAGAELLTDYVALGQLVRMAPTPAGRRRSEPDPDGEFINDALYLRTALVLDPGSAKVRSQMADLLDDFGEDAAARAVWEAPGGPTPTADVLLELAGYASGLSKTRDAIGYLERVQSSDRSSQWYTSRAHAALSLGDRAEALRLARESFRLSSRSGDKRQVAIGNWRLANILFQTGDRQGGEQALRAAIGGFEADDFLRGYAGLMLATFVPEQRAEGLRLARSVQGGFGDDHNFKSQLGSVLTTDDATLAEGVELLREALTSRPRSGEMLNALGYTLVDREVDVREGFLLLQQANERLPNDASIIDSLGWAYYRLGHLDEARALIERSAQMFTEDPNAEVFDHLGDIYWHQGRQDEAREMWRKALPLSIGHRGAAALPGKIANGLTTPVPPRQELPVQAEPNSI